MKPLKTVLHPTDYSDLSNRALRTALALAQEHGARLILLHVQEPQETIEGEFGMPPPEPEPDDQAILAQMHQLLPADLSIPVEYQVAHGNIADEIVKAAEATQTDLIVLARHGERNFFSRWFHANVAEHVIALAECEVMAVTENEQPAYHE